MFLSPLGEEEARHLIRELLRAATRETTAMIEDAIYALVGGDPEVILLAVRQAVESPDPDRIAHGTAQAVRDHYATLWRLLTPVEQAALRSLQGAATRAHRRLRPRRRAGSGA